MGKQVHAGGVHPHEKRFVCLGLSLHERLSSGGGFVVDGLHALGGQCAGVFNLAIGIGMDDPTRCGGLDKVRIIFRPIGTLGFFLGIEVVQVAEELVKTVIARQELIAVTQMVLAELTGRIAPSLECLRNGNVARLQADWRPGHSDFGQASTQRRLAGDERRTSCGATVLRVVVSEHHAFVGNAIDVRCLIADHAMAIGTDVGLADIVAEDHQNIGFIRRPGCRRKAYQRDAHQGHPRQPRALVFHDLSLLF
ncbi:hypothetical protein D3C81_763070 [compost metagenome]